MTTTGRGAAGFGSTGITRRNPKWTAADAYRR